jgi:hypothetical protein
LLFSFFILLIDHCILRLNNRRCKTTMMSNLRRLHRSFSGSTALFRFHPFSKVRSQPPLKVLLPANVAAQRLHNVWHNLRTGERDNSLRTAPNLSIFSRSIALPIFCIRQPPSLIHTPSFILTIHLSSLSPFFLVAPHLLNVVPTT